MFLRHAKLETTNRYTHETVAVNLTLIDPLEAMNQIAQNLPHELPHE
ncbi:hypothetical protein [Paenibacillus sp. FSL M7-1046]